MNDTASLKRVLLVDDEPEILDLLSARLNSSGFTVTSFTNSGFADSILHKQKFDAIITDYKMPFLDGVGIIKSARESEPNRNTPLIVISGVLTTPDLKKILSKGISSVLTKPFDPDLLVTKINEVIGKSLPKTA